MSEADDVRDELVETLLGTHGPPRVADGIRQAVLDRTTGVVRFRRRLRRCGLATGLVGCYLAGMATVTLWPRSDEARPQPLASTAEIAAPSPQPAPLSAAELAQARDRDAERGNPSREESLRRVADFYLFERGDIKSAVRNYKRALDLASAEQLAISPGQDSWLLMALKEARLKEMKHDRSATE